MSIPAALTKGLEMFTGVVSMNHRFTVAIDKSDYDLGSWAAASGLTVRWDPCTYNSSGRGREYWIFPGNPKYENIQLKRAACSDSATVQKWLRSTSRSPEAYSGTVQLLDWLGFPVVEWRMNEFFPISWRITEFEAAAGKPALETLELAHTGFLADDQR